MAAAAAQLSSTDLISLDAIGVKLVKDFVETSSGITHIPDVFVLPEAERPKKAPQSSKKHIPVIDMGHLHGEGRPGVLKAIAHACEEWGIFQIINHGIADSMIERMWQVAREFFDLPFEEKMKYYSTDATKLTRLGISVNPNKESTLHWRDYFLQICNPIPDIIETWPDKPESYRNASLEYSQAMKSLSEELLEALAETLGLESSSFLGTVGEPDQFLILNYYPPCPNPDLTFGFSSHSDPGVITILMQDEVEGLQVLHEGDWITVEPLKKSFVVNLGDALKVLTNGTYKSVDHRAVVNVKLRMTIPYFYEPAQDAKLKPFEKLIDENHPPLYKEFFYGQHSEAFEAKPLYKKSAVDDLKATELQA